MKGKQQDFRTEKYIRYGIRKYSFGAASVAIAAGLMFLGNGAVSATEVQNAETTISATASGQDDKEKEKAEPKAETVEAAKAAEVKAVETKKVNKAILEASIATLESKLSTAKYADATVVNSAKEVLATAKATLAKEDASQADVDAQAETVSALSTVVTESNTAGFDKKQAAEKEAAKAEAEKKATPAEKALSVAKTTLTQVSSEAEVTNKLAETELAKADVKEENKAAVTAAVAKNQAVLAETKALLADKSVTKEQVDAQLERLNESILAVYNELKNAGIGRDGKFAVNLDETQTTALKDSSTEAGQKWLADHGYSSLADIPIMNKGKDDKEIKEASKQIQWLDFTDTKAWTDLDDEGQLKIGSTFKKELIPGYVVTLTVKEMKPFHATETYKNRVAGTANEDTYNPNAVNSFKKATGIGGSAQTRWAHVKNAGFDTDPHKTTIAGTDDKSKQQNGTIAGVVFSVDAEYNGKKTKPTIFMTSGEDIKINESEIYTTNGTPWDLYALVGNEKETNPYIPNVKMRNVTSPQEFHPADDKLQKALVNSAFSTPDTATAGLGSQVFGSYINGENGSTQATPIVTTSGATEIGFYIISGGAQSSMIGISLSDFGDLPESYGKAEHSLKTSTTNYKTGQTEEIQQPYLGKVKADPDAQSGERVRGIGSDDATDSADEGVAELIYEKDVHINKDNGEPEVKIVQAADNTYRVRVIASANGNDNYTGTVEPAYVRGFIDFNNNGKFDEDEASNIVEVTGKDQEVELVFSNTQVIDTTKDKVNFRTRIAKSEKQVTKAIGTAFSGEVEDNQIQVSLPPRGDKEETTGKQGEKQSVGIEFISRVVGDDASDLGSNNGKTTFNSYGKLDYSEQSNTISAETTKKKQPEGVMIVNPDGRLTKTFTKEGQGTYEVTDTGVTFTPEANFVGTADGIVLRAVDANGQTTGWTALTDQNKLENVNNGGHSAGDKKTMDAVYIPTVTPKPITADPKTSIDVQGKEQKETPVFKTDAGKDNERVITPSATHPAKLIDPVTKAPTDAKTVTVDGEGTYTINPTTGEVTFQPLPTFTGKAKGVGVSLTAPVGVDKTGAEVTSTATTTYTPEVTPVKPTAEPATSTGIQGETQTGTPTFTAGNAAVPIKTGSVKLLNADGTEAQGAVPALDPKGNKVGEYTVDATTGVVTFTPTDKTYVGPVVPVKVQAEDNNGTKVETKYTPSIVGVKPTATPADSSNIQGAVQSGTVAFAPGKATIEGTEKSVAIKANSAVLLDKQGNKVAAGTPVDAEDENGNKVGEYTIDPATNTVTFTPTNKAYKGKVVPANVQAEDENGTTVKTTYTPNIVGVTPTADPAATTDIQGVEQSKEVTFKPGKTTINGVEKEVPIDTTSFKLLDETGTPAESVPAKNPAGVVIGTYTLKVVDGKPTAVFTPTDKTYAGEVKPVTIQAKDTNGTPVTTTYTPNITPVAPTGTPTATEGAQGQPQEGTPTFTPGDDKIPMKIDATQPAKLVDPATGNPIEETSIPAKDAKGNTVGTYTIEPTTGKVTFTPNKDFVGTPVPAKVQAKDANGTPTTATYTPTVKPVTPEGINTFTEDIQGTPQSGKPEFKPGKTTINGQEVEVPMDDNTPAKLVDPTTGQEVTSVTIPNEGTYTVDADGTVHFTPDPQFHGKGKTLKVVRQDTNGTKVTAEYTAVVKPATPEGTEVLTAGVQGKEQSGRPNFIGGKAEVNGVTKTVDIDETKPAKLIDPKTGQEATTVTIDGEGTYTVDPDGTVHFTPEKGFVGKGTELTVKRVDLNGTPALGKYTAVVIGTKPTAEPSVTSDIQGQTQSQAVKFKGGTVEVEDPITKVKTQETVAIDPSTYTLLNENGQAADSVPAKNPAGDVVGTYTLVKEEGKDPVAVFTPTDKSYTGEVKPVTVQAKDTNGVAVTTTYTPNITPVKPTAKAATSEGAQGQEQSGTPTFTEGHEKAPIDKTVPAKLVDPTTGQPTDEKSVTVPGEGTYTIDPDTGAVTFKPEPNFTGKAKGVEVQRKDTNGTPATAKYTPTVKPVTPTSDDVVSEDIQGAKQTGTPVFTPGKTTVNGQEVTVDLDPEVKPTLVGADEEGKVVVPNEGTYTIDENGVVTFTPEPNFTGKASGVTVKRADKNGTEVTAKYTPTVKPVTPTAKGATTTDVQGSTQTGKPVFTPGKTTVNGVEKTVELSDKPAKLVDPKTGDPVDSVTVDGEGTYTVDPDGTVTFTPEKSFTGQATGVTVKREDKNGTPVTAQYTPVVLPVTPTGKDVTSIGEKGAKQSETPVFKAGTTKLNGKTVTVPIDEKVAPTFEDSTTEKVVPGEGTYTIDKNGKVTFTPEKDFVGKATGVTVKRVDENGTPVTATYTPTVLGKTSTKDVTSEGPKNTPQSNTPEFKGDVDTTVPPTFEDGATKKVVPGEGTYTIDKDGKVTFTPEENFVGTATPVEVVRKDKNGRTIQASYTPTVRPDTKFVVVGKDGKETELLPSKDGENPSEKVSGYKVVKTEKDEKGNTKHIYEKVTTKHVDSKGNPIPGTTTEEGENPKKDIPGYKFVTTNKLPNGDTEHVYEKVITTFVDTEGHLITVDKDNNPVVSTEEGTTPKKDIPGYRFVETKTLENGDTEHVYEKVTTSFKDKEGKEIPNYPTEEGENPKKDIPGYKFVTTNKLPNGDTEHIYEKVKTTTSFVDESGKSVSPSEEGSQPKKDIPEYEFVKTTTDKDGNVTHVYRKVVKTTTSFVDESGKPVSPNEEGNQPKKDIPGYKFVTTKKLPNGDIEHVYEKVVVPTPTPTPFEYKVLTTYVDENGELIIPDENGSHPGKSLENYELVRTETDANGNVRNVYRKIQSPTPVQPVEPATPAMPEQPAKPEVPATPAQPVEPTAVKEAEGKRELPNTGTEDNASLAALGLLGVLSGFGLVARKKKED